MNKIKFIVQAQKAVATILSLLILCSTMSVIHVSADNTYNLTDGTLPVEATDNIVPTEATQKATEEIASTEATEQETSVMPTEPATEPATAPATEPALTTNLPNGITAELCARRIEGNIGNSPFIKDGELWCSQMIPLELKISTSKLNVLKLSLHNENGNIDINDDCLKNISVGNYYNVLIYPSHIRDNNNSFIQSGKYQLTVNLSNNESFAIATINFDCIAPIITNVSYSPAAGYDLKLVDFEHGAGLYSNGDTIVTITAYDEQFSSGLSDILLFTDDDSEMVSIKPYTQSITTTVNNDGGVYYHKSFILNSREKPYNLKAYAVDGVGNTPHKILSIWYTSLQKYNDYVNVECTTNNGNKKIENNYELIVNSNAADDTKTNLHIENMNNVKQIDDKFYCSSPVKILCDIQNNVFGLQSADNIKVTKDGVACDFTLNNESKGENGKIIKQRITINTEETLSKGNNIYTVSVKDNFGFEKQSTISICYDTTPPTVDSANVKYYGVDNKPVEDIGKWQKKVQIMIPFLEKESGIEKVEAYYNDTLYASTEENGKVKINTVKIEDKEYYCFDAEENSEHKYKIVATNYVEKKSNEFTTPSIKVDNEAPEIENIRYNGEEHPKWTNGEVNITFDVVDNLSGVGCVFVDGKFVSGSFDNGNKKKGTFSYTVTEKDIDKKIQIELIDGASNGGNKRTVSTENICIDSNPPEIVSFDFESSATMADKVLNFLTFGIYSNDEVKVTVSVFDNAPSSGIKNIILKNNGLEIVSQESVQRNGEVFKNTFVLEKLDSIYNLSAYATDVAGNSSDEKTAKEIGGSVIVAGEKTTIPAGVLEDVVSTNKPPIIGDINITEGSNKYTGNGSNVWYSYNSISFQFLVEDELSGLNLDDSIAVTFNGTDVTDKAEITSSTNTQGKKIITKDVVLSINTDLLAEGENTLSVSAKNNSGIVEVKTKKVFIDNTPPSISEWEIKENNGVKFYKEENKAWYSGDVTLSCKITDDYSGVDSCKVEFKNASSDWTEINCYTIQKSLNEWTVNLDTSKLPSGLYSDGENCVRITAKDKVSNSTTDEHKIAFYRDTQPPVINSYEIKSAETAVDKVLNLLTFGIYTNSDLMVTVYASDDSPSSGVADIQLEADNNQKIIGSNFKRNDNECSKQFRIPSNNENYVYYLTASATDNVGNGQSYPVRNIKGTIIETANGVELPAKEIPANTIDELVVNENNKPKITQYSTSNNGSQEYAEGEKYWYSEGAINFNFTVSDGLSGLNKYPVIFKINNKKYEIKDNTGAVENNSFKWTVTDEQSNTVSGKIIKKTVTVTVNTSLFQQGSNSIVINARNNNGNYSEDFVKTVYVDTIPPTVDSFYITSAESTADKIFSFLTFGIYHNNAINITVKASDGNDKSKSSGLNEITLYSNGKKLVSSKVSTQGEYTYTLHSEEQLSNITASVTDKVSNASAKTGLKGNNVRTTVNAANSTDFANINFDSALEIVSTKKKPAINSLTSRANSATNRYVDANNRVWYSGNAIFSFNAEDKISGIYSIKATLNGADIICRDSDNTIVPNNYVKLGKKVVSKYITVNTADATNYIEGKNTLKVTVTGNSGNSITKEITVFKDTTVPCNYSFSFTNASKYSQNTASPTKVTETDYGYYFTSDTYVTVSAFDALYMDNNDLGRPVGTTNDMGSGINFIHFWLVDQNGKITDYGNQKVNANNQAQFLVQSGFKGKIYAYAEDNTGNNIVNKCNGYGYQPYGVILETQSQHDNSAEKHIAFTRPATTKRDTDQNPHDLYNTTVPLNICIRDSYAGIAEVYYKITSSVGEIPEQEIKIDNKGNVTKTDDIVWKSQMVGNLVTELSSTINVAYNSNNINVEVTMIDRAGNVSKSTDTFSIDTTAPTMKVTYSENGNTASSGFYNVNRTATIVVTERNFVADDLNMLITGDNSGEVKISNWTVSQGTGNRDNTTYTATVLFDKDGDYVVDITCKDAADNKAASISKESFTIDKTKPTISVSYDNNSAQNKIYYSKKRTATITINEHNFDSSKVNIKIDAKKPDDKTNAETPKVSDWTNQGDIHTATVTFSENGSYSFSIECTDKANNKSQTVKEALFYIDKKAPVVEITNVEDEASYNNKVIRPVIKISDNNYMKGGYSATINRIDINAQNNQASDIKYTAVENDNGATITYDIKDGFDYDGIYTLEVYAADKAGNKSKTKKITFSVNRYGSTFKYSDSVDKTLKQSLETGYVQKINKDITIEEINVDSVRVKNVSVSCDSVVRDLEKEKDYTVEQKGEIGTNKWCSYVYTVKASNFSKDGSYVLTIETVDEAQNDVTNRAPVKGNPHQLPINFIIDSKSPSIIISGFGEDEKIETASDGSKIYNFGSDKMFEESSKNVKITIEDPNLVNSNNTKLENNSDLSDVYKIKLNNKELSAEKEEYKVDYENVLSGEITVELTVKGTENKDGQNLEVVVYDLAGNKSSGVVENFTLSATLLMMFFANTTLVVITFIIIGLLLTGVIIILIKKRKSKKQ